MKQESDTFDNKDEKLIKLLMRHPDWNYDKYAKELKMTERAVGYRIERLRKKKILQKAHLIFYDNLNYLIYTVILKFSTGIDSKTQNEIINELKNYENTIQVYETVGSYNLIYVFFARSPKRAEYILREKIICKKCFESYKVSQVTELSSIYRAVE
ncbi:MAG: Lrp/AsnC family transcriptional regulator [Candidatus Methanofastidiosia archaeon]